MKTIHLKISLMLLSITVFAFCKKENSIISETTTHTPEFYKDKTTRHDSSFKENATATLSNDLASDSILNTEADNHQKPSIFYEENKFSISAASSIYTKTVATRYTLRSLFIAYE